MMPGTYGGTRFDTPAGAPSGTAPAMARVGGLAWFEYGLLLAAAVAAAVAVDPFEWGLAAEPVIKHLALLILLPTLLLAAAGRKIGEPLTRIEGPGRLLRAAWPLLLLGSFIAGGSLYARLVLGIQNTFLNVGLYMLVTPCVAAMVLRTRAVLPMLRAYFSILVAAGGVMGVFLIANHGVRQVYHEQIFLVIPLAVLFLTAGGSAGHRAAGLFFLSMAWFSQKYTAYLIGALTVVYLMMMAWHPRLDARPAVSRAATVYWSWLVLAFAILVLVLWARRNPEALPTGNPEYRLHTYAAAWDRFLESPLWGSRFAVEAVEKFSLYAIGIAGNVLPTHSDVLDLMAHGGAIALGLWLLGLVLIGRAAHGALLNRRRLGHPWARYAHTLASLSVAGVVTYTFNPILLQPAMAFLLWANLGLLLGLTLRAERAAGPGAARGAPR